MKYTPPTALTISLVKWIALGGVVAGILLKSLLIALVGISIALLLLLAGTMFKGI